MAFYEGNLEKVSTYGGDVTMPLRNTERPIVDLDHPFFEILVMTGTFAKYCNANRVYREGVAVPAAGITYFEKAGQAPEPVTPDIELLILGKQRGQRQIFVENLNDDPEIRKKYHMRRVVTTTNDINTKIEGRPLTKVKIQKEGRLTKDDYRILMRASLKYLLAEVNGVLPANAESWEQLTSNLDLLRKFDQESKAYFKPGRNYILPIDFQSIDAFEALDVDAPGNRAPKLQQVGPAVIVLHRSYALLNFAVEEDGQMTSFERSINHYLWQTMESVNRHKYAHGRCPLGIYWAELFKSMTVSGMDVTLSVAGHDEHSVELRERHQAAEYLHGQGHAEASMIDKSIEAVSESLERKQDGFSKESFTLAMEVFMTERAKNNERVVTITCKPGEKPMYKRRNISR